MRIHTCVRCCSKEIYAVCAEELQKRNEVIRVLTKRARVVESREKEVQKKVRFAREQLGELQHKQQSISQKCEDFEVQFTGWCKNRPETVSRVKRSLWCLLGEEPESQLHGHDSFLQGWLSAGQRGGAEFHAQA